MIAFSEEEARWLRFQAQRLGGRAGGKPDNPRQVVEDVCGLQAQEAPAAALGVRARSSGLTESDVEHARVEDRSLVRSWGQRGTLHLLAAADLGWLISLLGPVFIAKNQHRYRELGLDEETITRGLRVLHKALSDRGPLTRAEIRSEFESEGVPAEGQALIYLIQRGALEGQVCLGPDRGKQPTYVLVEDWIRVEKTPPEEVALAEMARRYLGAYGPAGPPDLAAWSGLEMGKVRRAWELIAPERVEVEAAGSPAWMLASRLEARRASLESRRKNSPSVRLLPRFDTYLLGYASRDFALEPHYARRINAGGGIIHAALCVDGRTLGTWKTQKKRDQMIVQFEPFERLEPELIEKLEAEVGDIGRFYGLSATLQFLNSEHF